jgi:hypothetical protein
MKTCTRAWQIADKGWRAAFRHRLVQRRLRVQKDRVEAMRRPPVNPDARSEALECGKRLFWSWRLC